MAWTHFGVEEFIRSVPTLRLGTLQSVTCSELQRFNISADLPKKFTDFRSGIYCFFLVFNYLETNNRVLLPTIKFSGCQ